MLHVCFRGEAGERFFREKLMPRDEGQLVREAVAAAVVSDANRLLLPVLQRALVHACVVLGCFGICGCRSQCTA